MHLYPQFHPSLIFPSTTAQRWDARLRMNLPFGLDLANSSAVFLFSPLVAFRVTTL